VTNSLAALSKGLVYCTEPFRISYAGMLDVLCFDKTGTLTQDRMQLRGIVAQQYLSLRSIGSGSGDKGRRREGLATISTSDAIGLDDIVPESSPVTEILECRGNMEGQYQIDGDDATVIVDSDITLCILGLCHDLINTATLPNKVESTSKATHSQMFVGMSLFSALDIA
jgi:magnesium-transporting ATPase (P-type)